jgi:ferredoxin
MGSDHFRLPGDPAKSTLILVANKDRCIGAGLCVLTTPDVFTQDDDLGTVQIRVSDPFPEYEESVRQAVNLCPSGAIQIMESE